MYSLFCLFVALLCSNLFPLIFAEPFFLCTDFVSVLPSGTNSYSLFLARKKMDDNSGGGGGFNCV